MSGRLPSEVPHFVRAASAERLKDEMLKVNLALGIQNKFFDISYVNGQWFAWYYADSSTFMKMNSNKVKLNKE